MFDVKIEVDDAIAEISFLIDRLSPTHFTKVFNEIGDYIITIYQKKIDSQSEGWKPLKGNTIRQKRLKKQPLKIGIATGAMRNGFIKIVTPTGVAIGNQTSYSIHFDKTRPLYRLEQNQLNQIQRMVERQFTRGRSVD
jgi:hypothetical protein